MKVRYRWKRRSGGAPGDRALSAVRRWRQVAQPLSSLLGQLCPLDERLWWMLAADYRAAWMTCWFCGAPKLPQR